MHGQGASALVLASVLCCMLTMPPLSLGSRCDHSGSGSVSTTRRCCRDLITATPSRVRIKVNRIIIGQNLVGKIISAGSPVGHAVNHSASADRHRRHGATATSRSQIK